jgi:hypothetical protein
MPSVGTFDALVRWWVVPAGERAAHGADLGHAISSSRGDGGVEQDGRRLEVGRCVDGPHGLFHHPRTQYLGGGFADTECAMSFSRPGLSRRSLL